MIFKVEFLHPDFFSFCAPVFQPLFVGIDTKKLHIYWWLSHFCYTCNKNWFIVLPKKIKMKFFTLKDITVLYNRKGKPKKKKREKIYINQ
ncbi:MAG: hypothetical protein AYK19_10160 [Theionarchaea archaeon DG-70-1]|nr:MAG: hypothetical protein AYK19_10160 [Theionarchaea archaeon DG-70-1]